MSNKKNNTESNLSLNNRKTKRTLLKYGGDSGIRTHDALLAHTPLAGEHLQPLGHVSSCAATERSLVFSISKLRFPKSKSCMQSSNSKFHIFIL